MSEMKILDSDIVPLRSLEPIDGKHSVVARPFWGDRVKTVGRTQAGIKVELPLRLWTDTKKRYEDKVEVCLLPKQFRFRKEPLLKIRIIDSRPGRWRDHRHMYDAYSGVLVSRGLPSGLVAQRR